MITIFWEDLDRNGYQYIPRQRWKACVDTLNAEHAYNILLAQQAMKPLHIHEASKPGNWLDVPDGYLNKIDAPVPT
jgi:hypothetical protein